MLNLLLSLLLAGIPVCIVVCVALVLMQKIQLPAFFWGIFGLAAGVYMAAIVSFYMFLADETMNGIVELSMLAQKSPMLVMEHLKGWFELYHDGKQPLLSLIWEICRYAAPTLVGGVCGCLCCVLLRNHCRHDEDAFGAGIFSAMFTFLFYIALAIVALILMLLFAILDSLTSNIVALVLIGVIVGALCSGGGWIIIEILLPTK